MSRARRYAVAAVVALTIAVVAVVASFDGADAPGGRLGGDYPAFYGAGEIANAGDWDVLYSARRQAEAQAELWETEGSFLYFAYPPFVAGAYAPLAALDYRLSFLIHSVLMAAALWGAVTLGRRLLPWIGPTLVVPFAVALFFYPMMRAVIGGQNVALTLLLVVLAAWLERDARPFLAGIAVALLLYKPQFGIPLFLLLIVARRWQVLTGWAAGAAGLFLVGAIASGPAWIGDWWSQATAFASENAEANGQNFISLPGVLAHLGGDAGWVVAASTVIIVTIGGLAALLWWRHPLDVAGRYAVGVAAIIAIAPQALFYEAGLLLFVAAVAVAGGDKWTARTLAIIWLAGFAQLLAPLVGFSPLVFLVMFVGWMSVRAISIRPLAARVPSV